MGLVYLAQQKEPVKRKVALKIVKLGMDTKQVVARFEIERQTLALLEHPNIAHVFDAGTTEAGRPYFVMEYVEGKSVTKYCDEQKLNVEERLGLFRQVCESVHHAHQKGIIHRDIKPSNILVSVQDNKLIPKIIDFGIAKAITQPLTENTSYTEQGQLLGTPEYMSPEQAEMAYQDVDTRSDIYSLGVVLYELLAGVPPFDAKELREGGIDRIQQIICKEELRTPSARLTSLGDKARAIAERRKTQFITLTRRLHRELEWIPMKAMRKDRTRRYRSASELADDVQNYLTGLPLIAGPESTVYRARKFVRKHAGSVMTVALVAVVIIIGLVVSILMGCRAERARRQQALARMEAEQARTVAQEQQQAAERQADEYRRLLYVHRIALADVSYRNGDVQRVRELLTACPEELRGWEWHRLNHISDQSERTLHGHEELIMCVALSPDGKRITSGSFDKTIKVWDVASGRELRTLRGHESAVGPVAFSPDGSRIVSGSHDKTVRVWDAASGDELMMLSAHDGPVGEVAFSPNGERIISCGDRSGNSRIGDENVRIWDATTGDQVMSLSGHDGPVYSAAYSPDGTRIVSGGRDKTIKIWDAAIGAELITLKGHEGRINSVVFSADGKRVLSGGKDAAVIVWDAASGDELTTFRGHTGSVYDVAFSPDGRRVASSSRDRTVRLWDVTTNAEVTTLYGHTDQVASVAFSPNGDRVISGGLDKTIKAWDVTIDRGRIRLGDRGRVVGFSPDGTRMVAAGRDATIKVLDAGTGAELTTLRGHDGNRGGLLEASFSSDGRRIVSSAMDKTSKIWDAESGAELMTLSRDKGCVHARFSPDGRWIASWAPDHWRQGPYENTIKLHDAATGEEVMTLLGHEGQICSGAFSPDSKRLVSCDVKETIKMWDTESGEEVMTLKHTGGSFCVAFSPDASRIATGGSNKDKTIKIWDAETGAEILTLEGHDSAIGSLAFSSDGRRLVSGGRHGIVKLWDVTTGFEVMDLQERGAKSAWEEVRFSPDGKTIAIGSNGITLLESSAPVDGYEARQTGAAARKLADELREEHGLYAEVIAKLKANERVDEAVRKVALQIANARLWEDTEDAGEP
jgi:WD40 repeat protein/predicted Ser/Thr protein kinase